jgi:hypothetical protein
LRENFKVDSRRDLYEVGDKLGKDSRRESKRGFGKVISCETAKGFELRRRMIFPLYLKKFEMDQKGI